jgi:hypothetical protein
VPHIAFWQSLACARSHLIKFRGPLAFHYIYNGLWPSVPVLVGTATLVVSEHVHVSPPRGSDYRLQLLTESETCPGSSTFLQMVSRDPWLLILLTLCLILHFISRLACARSPCQSGNHALPPAGTSSGQPTPVHTAHRAQMGPHCLEDIVVLPSILVNLAARPDVLRG